MSKFFELSRSKIGNGEENKHVVISSTEDGNVSIAQQIQVPNGAKTMGIFLKNSIICSHDELVAFRDAVDEAIGKLEKKSQKSEKTLK